MNWILALAGYDPDKEARHPRHKTDKNKKRTTARVASLPDNVQTNRITKKPERYVREEDDVHFWQQVAVHTDFGERTAILNEEEREHLAGTRNMLIEKAEILKVYWASGMTAKEAARDFTERGYSYETVRKYWTIFNRFSPSPTENLPREEE